MLTASANCGGGGPACTFWCRVPPLHTNCRTAEAKGETKQIRSFVPTLTLGTKSLRPQIKVDRGVEEGRQLFGASAHTTTTTYSVPTWSNQILCKAQAPVAPSPSLPPTKSDRFGCNNATIHADNYSRYSLTLCDLYQESTVQRTS